MLTVMIFRIGQQLILNIEKEKATQILLKDLFNIRCNFMIPKSNHNDFILVSIELFCNIEIRIRFFKISK